MSELAVDFWGETTSKGSSRVTYPQARLPITMKGAGARRGAGGGVGIANSLNLLISSIERARHHGAKKGCVSDVRAKPVG